MFGLKQRENIYSKKLTVKVVFFFSSLFFLCLKLFCSIKIVIKVNRHDGATKRGGAERPREKILLFRKRDIIFHARRRRLIFIVVSKSSTFEDDVWREEKWEAAAKEMEEKLLFVQKINLLSWAQLRSSSRRDQNGFSVRSRPTGT